MWEFTNDDNIRIAIDDSDRQLYAALTTARTTTGITIWSLCRKLAGGRSTMMLAYWKLGIGEEFFSE